MQTYMSQKQRVKAGKRGFGALVESLRKEREWSISRLAQKAGLSSTRIVDIEKMDEPRVFGETMRKLATAFEMEPQDLRRRYEELNPHEGISPDVLEEIQRHATEAGLTPDEWIKRLLRSMQEIHRRENPGEPMGSGVVSEGARMVRPPVSEVESKAHKASARRKSSR